MLKSLNRLFRSFHLSQLIKCLNSIRLNAKSYSGAVLESQAKLVLTIKARHLKNATTWPELSATWMRHRGSQAGRANRDPEVSGAVRIIDGIDLKFVG